MSVLQNTDHLFLDQLSHRLTVLFAILERFTICLILTPDKDKEIMSCCAHHKYQRSGGRNEGNIEYPNFRSILPPTNNWQTKLINILI